MSVPSWAVKPETTQRIFLQIRPDSQASPEQTCIDTKPGYLIGRNGQTCDFPVPDKSASRIHACIAHKASQGPVLLDLGSVHGDSLSSVLLITTS